MCVCTYNYHIALAIKPLAPFESVCVSSRPTSFILLSAVGLLIATSFTNKYYEQSLQQSQQQQPPSQSLSSSSSSSVASSTRNLTPIPVSFSTPLSTYARCSSSSQVLCEWCVCTSSTKSLAHIRFVFHTAL